MIVIMDRRDKERAVWQKCDQWKMREDKVTGPMLIKALHEDEKAIREKMKLGLSEVDDKNLNEIVNKNEKV